MAFNLTATLQIKDKASSSLKRVSDSVSKFRQQTERLTKGQETLSRASGKLITVNGKLASSQGQVTSGLRRTSTELSSGRAKMESYGSSSGRLLGTVTRLAAAYLSLRSAVSLFHSTVGNAMDMEQQNIAMEHFIGLNTPNQSDAKAATKDMMGWLRKNANETPFGTNEVISSGTRAIGVSDGDLDQAKKLVGIAEDMAALTPGKTISDAMEALADMKMGEMERMKEFNFKATADQMKALGGGDLVKGAMEMMNTQVATKFDGGAKKLSKSAAGLWATTQGNIEAGLTDMGTKSLDLIKPELKKLADWTSGPEFAGFIKSASKVMADFFKWLVSLADWVTSHKKEIKEFFIGLKEAATQFWNVVGPIFEMLAKFISKHPKLFADAVIALIGALLLVKSVLFVISFIEGIALAIEGLTAVVGFIIPLLEFIPGIIGAIGLAFEALFALVMMFPITAAIVAAIAVIILLWKNWDKVTKWCSKAWKWFVDKIKSGDLIEWFKKHWTVSLLAGPIGLAMGLLIKYFDKVKAFGKGIRDVFAKIGIVDDNKEKTKKAGTKTSAKKTKVDGSHRFGSSFIGHDGIFQLHKGERVLTAKENQNYTYGRTQQKPVTFQFGDIHISGSDDPEKLADKFLKTITKKLKEAGELSW